MSDQLRDRLHAEMTGLDRPSIDGLVQGAVTRGTGVRRRRRIVSGAGTTAVVATVAAVVALGGVAAPDRPASISGIVGSAPTTAALAQPATTAAVAPQTAEPAAAPSVAVPAPASAPASAPADLQAQIKAQRAKLHADKPGSVSAGIDKNKLATLGSVGPVRAAAALPPGVPATPTGMLELLTQLLPPGSSHQGVTDDGSLGVEAYVSTSTGPAMVRVGLGRAVDVPVGCSVLPHCTVEPNGDIVTVRHLTDNCIGTDSVEVFRPDGSDVAISLGTCLQWDGTQNAPSASAMTIEQAKAIALDPRWDLSMSPALVSAGAAHFPSPIQFG